MRGEAGRAAVGGAAGTHISWCGRLPWPLLGDWDREQPYHLGVLACGYRNPLHPSFRESPPPPSSLPTSLPCCLPPLSPRPHPPPPTHTPRPCAEGQLEERHIFCAKCGNNQSTDDNDIILCDGPCSRAYHERCLDPPIRAAELPEEEGWLCPACDAKARAAAHARGQGGVHSERGLVVARCWVLAGCC